jgi:phthalate 4,5-cis-dihydrodiol dehydrogenase
MIRIGVAGLGYAATLLIPSILEHPGAEVVALAEPNELPREAFCEDFAIRATPSFEELLALDDLDAIYVATPHQFHAEHVVAALRSGRHVLVEKPMALTLADCDEMIAAQRESNKVLQVGHTHAYDPPVLALRALVEEGRFGRLGMITALNYTGYLYLPRRPEELDTSRGGGIVFNQLPHQIDTVRTISGATPSRLSAVCGSWDGTRPTEASAAALLRFDDGLVASVTYSGYAHLEGSLLYRGLDREGPTATQHAELRRRLRSLDEAGEVEARVRGGYPSRREAIAARHELGAGHERFGLLVCGFEHADVVPSPTGLTAFTDDGPEEIVVPPGSGGGRRATVIDEFCRTIAGGEPLHDGPWGRTTLAVCLAVLESSAAGREVAVAS